MNMILYNINDILIEQLLVKFFLQMNENALYILKWREYLL